MSQVSQCPMHVPVITLAYRRAELVTGSVDERQKQADRETYVGYGIAVGDHTAGCLRMGRRAYPVNGAPYHVVGPWGSTLSSVLPPSAGLCRPTSHHEVACIDDECALDGRSALCNMQRQCLSVQSVLTAVCVSALTVNCPGLFGSSISSPPTSSWRRSVMDPKSECASILETLSCSSSSAGTLCTQHMRHAVRVSRRDAQV